MRLWRPRLFISLLGCALIMGALIATPAMAAKKSLAKPVIPKEKVALQKAFEKELVVELNKARRSRGLRPLRRSRILTKAAHQHSKYMAKTSTLSHEGRGGAPFWKRFVKLGYSRNARMSEVIAKRNVCRRGDPRIIIRKWIKSKPHRVLMFDRKIKYYGAGVASKSRCSLTFYTLDFGS